MGSIGTDSGLSIAIDIAGNVFTTGYFNNTADFDPGLGTFNLTSVGSDDIFISKLDVAGNFVWAKALGGTSGDIAYSIAVDTSGNIFTTGFFISTVDFDPTLGIFNLTSAGGSDIFITKLDSVGNFVWANAMGGSNDDSGYSIAVDATGNVFTTGSFRYTVDFDPGFGTFNLSSAGDTDIFISKLDADGNFVWAIAIGGGGGDSGGSIAFDDAGNVLTTGNFQYTGDFDPGIGIYNLTAGGTGDIFISKLDTAGSFVWAKRMGGADSDYGKSIALDTSGNVFSTGSFRSTVDFDPGPGIFNLTSDGLNDIFISKLDADGNFVWAKRIGGSGYDICNSIVIDVTGNVIATGHFTDTVDFDPGIGNFNLIGNDNIFIVKLGTVTTAGYVFMDLNANCIKDSLEVNVRGTQNLNIQPGNFIVQTHYGYWQIDSLSPGTYTATVDTSGQWKSTCSPTVSFTVVHPDSFVQAPSIGMRNTNPCTEPEISIMAPVLRRCLTNQNIFVNATNNNQASQILYNAYADVTLDSFLTVTSATRPYTSLSNNVFRFQLDSLYPGQSKTWTISTTVSCSTTLGQTLCMNAELFPVAPCVLDSTPGFIGSCTSPVFDQSHLKVKGDCTIDSVIFTITNLGTGDMQCFRPVRIYIDGVLTYLDSVLLNSGSFRRWAFEADGRTWRCETEQHPLHPGNPHPSTNVSACGDSTEVANFYQARFMNSQPHDDADPVIDIYCGVVSGSFDPNDKTGYPTGVTNNHYILKNQQLQYVIRFQNTGTDTAFTVVIRDTLETDLNIFSVKTGVSSHNYSFRMYGPRVLEWTFNNIMLPDSFHSEPNSHGFVTFTVEQVENLPNGTLIENSAAIYFDFNDPIITNKSQHTITETWPLITSVYDINNVQSSDIQVYPNPTEDKLHVLSNLPSSIKLLDLTGRLLKNLPVKQKSHELNLSEFPAGIYLLEVQVNEKIEVKKVIRK